MRFEHEPQFFPEEEEHIGEVPQKKVEKKKTGTIKRVAGKVVRRAALGAAIGITMLPGSKDVPSVEFQRSDIPRDSHHAPIPSEFDVPRHPEKGLIENLPSGIQRVPERQEEELPANEEREGAEIIQEEDKIGMQGEQEEKEEGKIEAKAEIKQFEPSVTVLDIKMGSPEEVDAFLQKALGDDYVSRQQLISEFGEDFEKKWPEVLEKYPKALAYAFLDAYVHHGDNVVDVAEGMWNHNLIRKSSGLESIRELEVTPLQEILDSSSFKKVEDELGNKGISIDFDEQKIIESLSRNPDKIINFSFQVGNVEVFMDERTKVTPDPDFDLGPGYYDKEGNFFAIDRPDYGLRKNVKNAQEAREILSSNEGQFLLDNGVIFFGENNDTMPIGYAHAKEREGKLVVPDIIPRQEVIRRWEEAKDKAARSAKVIDLETPQIRIVGAYDSKKAQGNLQKLFAIASAYPDKLFVAAGGNSGEDIMKAMEELSDKRPPNLLIVSEWSGEEWKPRHKMYGAGMYVDNNYLGSTGINMRVPEGSSFSTPIITAYAALLHEKGLSISETIKTMESTTYEERYRPSNQIPIPATDVFYPDEMPTQLSKNNLKPSNS